MAGSMHHVIDDGRYTGPDLIENLGDAIETIEELVFVLLSTTTDHERAKALSRYLDCANGRDAWPVWWPDGPAVTFLDAALEGE